ncbi:MAG: glutamate--tRNA ligase, partial [Acidiferrobacter sp.]
MNSLITRFAPSPSGFLHLGNVRTALFSLLAALPDGRFLVRIEDTDRARVEHRFEEAALADLEWLGFGPYIDRAAILYQSTRTAIYDDYLERLFSTGQVYPCFCSQATLAAERAEAQAKGRPPRYFGHCAKLSPAQAEERLAHGESAVWRFRVPAGQEVAFTDVVRGQQIVSTDLLGDFVVRRNDGAPMFFFTNALDDALSGVTLVLRGEDHLSNTARQILLLKALDLPAPQYGH